MIKKIIWLIILGIAVYVGYLVWNNLNPKEKDAVLNLGGKVVDKTKDVAKDAADAITDKTKKVINDKLIDDQGKPKPRDPPPTTGPTPSGNTVRIPAEAPNQKPPEPTSP